jgi:membrane-associated protein
VRTNRLLVGIRSQHHAVRFSPIHPTRIMKSRRGSISFTSNSTSSSAIECEAVSDQVKSYVSVKDSGVEIRFGRLACLGVLGMILGFSLFMPDVAQAASAAVETVEPSGPIVLLKQAISFVLHLDVHLGDIVSKYGALTYAILFSIVFAETGLVVTPLLPGDSLLFATGALAALGKLNLVILLTLYVTAATIGDAVNYSIGKYFGKKALNSKFIKREYVQKTEEYYATYGGKTIVLARFVPIVRTFAPFVAGIGSMAYKTFALYNVLGAVLWTGICVGAGYLFGNIPAVHNNFSLVVLGIIAVSVLPVVYEILSVRIKGPNNAGRVGSVRRQGNSLAVGF